MNHDCPMRGDYCPVPDFNGVCRFEDIRDEEEIARMKKAIDMIDDYLLEPNSISADWVRVLKICKRLLCEKVKE